MKNIVKKVLSIAMAFSIIGTGTFVFNLNENNSITVSAAPVSSDVWRYTYPDSNDCFAYGSRGDKVKWVQAMMNYILGPTLEVDGIYGAKTKAKVIEFQQLVNNTYGYKKLTVDGIFGPKTYEQTDVFSSCGCC